jgi:predicted Rossmann fold flavoprotein
MNSLSADLDVLVLGAGAAGLFCAIEAARRGRRVAVLDHAKAPAEKIRISGGGRCNFTNLHCAPDRFISGNPRFAASALARYTAADFVARINRAGIAWHEKTLGQLFCDGSARQVVDMLVGDLLDAGAALHLGVHLGDIRQDSGFVVETSIGQMRAASLVVATGGKSIPKMGATAFGYRVAENFGLRVTETRPGLVPLTFGAGVVEGMRALAGLSVQAEVSCGRARFAEGLLLTHRGLSGPSILQISNYWREGQGIRVNLAPGQDVAAHLAGLRSTGGRGAVQGALAGVVPERLARALAEWAGLSGNLADQSKSSLAQLVAQVSDWQLVPVGSEGYRTAEVTLGGVDTRDLDARTLQARSVPGLFFVGEVVDVTGWLGGYNFQWAWSSGWAAGQVA